MAETSRLLFIANVKSDKQILENSMPEEDPNSNACDYVDNECGPRWGPHHEGAKQLQLLYTQGLQYL